MDHTFTTIATGIDGAEGPVFDRTNRMFVVSSPHGSIIEIDTKTGATREHANTGGIPAGLQVDRDNFLWVADMKLGILRISPDGQASDGVRTFEGQAIRGCNDCIFDSRGNLYFSAPAGSNASTPVGEVYCRTRDGEVHLIDNGYAFSNGVAVSSDDSLLFVAETYTNTLWVYDIDSPGVVSNKRVFARLPGEGEGGPDGLDFDSEGNLLAANWKRGSVDVFDPQGQLMTRLHTPFEKPSNVHFGGDDRRTLYVTELSHGAVLSTRWRCSGQAGYADIDASQPK